MHLPITKLQSQGQIYLARHLCTWDNPAPMKQMPAMTQMKVPKLIHPSEDNHSKSVFGLFKVFAWSQATLF